MSVWRQPREPGEWHGSIPPAAEVVHGHPLVFANPHLAKHVVQPLESPSERHSHHQALHLQQHQTALPH